MSYKAGSPAFRDVSLVTSSRFIAERSGRIDASGIRRIFDLAASLRNPIDLSIGQPCHDVPDAVKEAAVRAIRNGYNRYTPTQGDPELVAALLERIARRAEITGRTVLVTSGVSAGLFLALNVLVNPGDEVIMGDPYFVVYRQVVEFLGGVAVTVDTYPDFRLTAERIEPVLTSRTKIIIVSSPNNPTGVVSTDSELREIAEVARRHGLLVFTDEIYSAFSYEGPAPSILPYCEDVILFSGFSKSHAAPGWRLGYAFGPEPILREMAKLQQYSFVCAPAPAQRAILETLDLDTKKIAEIYRRKRDLICDGLRDKFEFVVPGGAFYLFPRVPRGTDTEFVEKAIRHNVLVVPGSIFSRRNTHFRTSYAAPDETIRRGIEALNRLAAI